MFYIIVEESYVIGPVSREVGTQLLVTLATADPQRDLWLVVRLSNEQEAKVPNNEGGWDYRPEAYNVGDNWFRLAE